MIWDGEESPVTSVRVEPTSYSVIMDGHSVGVNIDRIRSIDPDLHGFRASLYDGAYDFTLQDPHKILLAAAMARGKKGACGLVAALMPGQGAQAAGPAAGRWWRRVSPSSSWRP